MKTYLYLLMYGGVSMFVPQGETFLSGTSLTRLEHLYAQENQARAKARLQCAVLRKKGESQPFIAEVTGLPVTTVSGILRRFEERGVNGCYAIKQQGQPRKLSPNQRTQLKKILSGSPQKQGLPFVVWTTKLVQYIVHKKFGVSYVARQIQRILKSLGFSLQKPRPCHLKANKRLQAQFKKNCGQDFNDLGRLDMRSSFWTKARST